METNEIDPKTLIGKMFIFLDRGEIHKAFLICGIEGQSFVVERLGAKDAYRTHFLIDNLLHFLEYDKNNPEYYHKHGYQLLEGKEYDYFSS